MQTLWLPEAGVLAAKEGAFRLGWDVFGGITFDVAVSVGDSGEVHTVWQLLEPSGGSRSFKAAADKERLSLKKEKKLHTIRSGPTRMATAA